MFDSYRTLLDAGPAGQAVPKGFLPNARTNQRVGILIVWLAATLDDARANFDEVVFEVFCDVHGRQGLPADVGRTCVRAPAADRAGVAVEQLLPGKVLHFCGPEDFRGIEVTRGWQSAHRFEGTKEEAERRADQVHMLGQGNIHGEPQNYGDVRPPKDGVDRSGGRLGESKRGE